jgi:hypothetical protein
VGVGKGREPEFTSMNSFFQKPKLIVLVCHKHLWPCMGVWARLQQGIVLESSHLHALKMYNTALDYSWQSEISGFYRGRYEVDSFLLFCVLLSHRS